MLFWLIETKDQLSKFSNRGYTKAFIDIIPYNPWDNAVENNICALYIKPLDSNKSFIFPIKHNESFCVELDEVEKLIDDLEIVYSRDKKELLHYITHKNIVDITFDKDYVLEYTPCHNFFYSRNNNHKEINTIIPISKHYELCNKVFNDLKPRIDQPVNNFYNKKTSLVFNYIERSGIKINPKYFTEFFYETDKNVVYTKYNIKTLTSRPSNHFHKINFAALNKENGCRKSFIPSNDMFVELDITAYHPVLLATLIDFKFDNPDIHGEFAKMYGVDYNKSKHITFQMLYGEIFDQYKNLKYFSKVQRYKDKIWRDFNENGYVECPITKYRFEKSKLDNINASKLLNYIIQNLETSTNVNMLWEIIKILRNKKTKIVLYVYDSILLDFDESEQDTLDAIKNVFRLKDLSIKEKIGYNYHDLK